MANRLVDKQLRWNPQIRGQIRIPRFGAPIGSTRGHLFPSHPFALLHSPSSRSHESYHPPPLFVTVFSAQQFAHQSNYLARNNSMCVTHEYDGNSFTGYFFFFSNFFSFSRAFFLSRYSFARPVGCKTRFLIVWWKSVGGTGFTTVKICERYVILFFF